ncbi:MAG: hypothetical protein ACXVBR_18130 [Flavisolibacter sp.]
MVLRSSIATYLLLALVFLTAGILYLGRGQEEGNAVAKEVQSFLSYNIESSNFSVINRTTVAANEVPLPISKAFKYVAKRLLITMGIAIDRKSYAIEFDIQSQQSRDHLYCLVRVHGDQVLEIIIRSSSKNDSSAVHLQKLIQSSFPDYEVSIL